MRFFDRTTRNNAFLCHVTACVARFPDCLFIPSRIKTAAYYCRRILHLECSPASVEDIHWNTHVSKLWTGLEARVALIATMPRTKKHLPHRKQISTRNSGMPLYIHGTTPKRRPFQHRYDSMTRGMSSDWLTIM
jgi:hypothetical protein